MPEHDRDRSVENTLRRVLTGPPQAPVEDCLDAETMAAWTSGSLPANGAAAVEHHVAGCARCQAMMAAFIQSEPAPIQAESLWRRWRLQWAVPLATAATVAALWVAMPGNAPVAERVDLTSQARIEPRSDAAALARESTPPSELQAPAALESRRAAAPAAPAPAPTISGPMVAAPATPSAPAALDDKLAAVTADAPAANTARAERAEADTREVAAGAAEASRAARQAFALIEIAASGGARWRLLGNRVESSTNGTDWTPASLVSPDVLTAGAAPSSTVFWIVGRRGAVYLTTDGRRFTRLAFPDVVDLVSVTAPDDRRATVTATDGRSWTTADQGRTWSGR